MVRPPFDEPDPKDLEVVSIQLGRPARGVIGIAARCRCGAPTVVATAPQLEDGTPFPTLYYLSHPAATAAVSQLEANGQMASFNDLLIQDERVQLEYREAHESYLRDRESLGVVHEIEGISAGGMPTRVKCLHALVAHSLAVGAGINPIGDRALELATWSPDECACQLTEPTQSQADR